MGALAAAIVLLRCVVATCYLLLLQNCVLCCYSQSLAELQRPTCGRQSSGGGCCWRRRRLLFLFSRSFSRNNIAKRNLRQAKRRQQHHIFEQLAAKPIKTSWAPQSPRERDSRWQCRAFERLAKCSNDDDDDDADVGYNANCGAANRGTNKYTQTHRMEGGAAAAAKLTKKYVTHTHKQAQSTLTQSQHKTQTAPIRRLAS